jgi:hypothetical protein
MIACATAEVRHAAINGHVPPPKGWIASAKYWPLGKYPLVSVGSGRTRDEALEDLTTLIGDEGVADPHLFETRDSFKRAFLLRQASLQARLRQGIEFEIVQDA